MRNLMISALVVGLLSLLPLSPRVGPSSGLLPVSISLGQDEAKAYVTYRRAGWRRGGPIVVATTVAMATTVATILVLRWLLPSLLAM